MNKRGISTVVVTVLIIMLSIVAMVVFWIYLMPFVSNRIDEVRVTSILMNEKISITDAGQGEFPEILDIAIRRGDTELLIDVNIVNITETVYYEVPIPTDIYLLVDLSGSMRFFVDYDCMKDGINLGPSCSFPNYNTYTCTGYCKGEVVGGYVPLDILKESVHDFVGKIMDLNNNTDIALMGFRDSLGSEYQPDYPYLDFTNDSVALSDEIDSWKADGGTYVSQGMELTYDNFLPREVDNKILIILGDGDCTGYSCSADSMAYASDFDDLNITVHTIGFGPNANTALFQGIADSGGGDYHDSSEFENLAIVFRDIIGKTNITSRTSREVSIPGVFLDIVVFSGGESKAYRIKTNLPGAFEGRRYSLDLSEFTDGWVVEDITKVEVYLIAVSEGGLYSSAFMSRYEFD